MRPRLDRLKKDPFESRHLLAPLKTVSSTLTFLFNSSNRQTMPQSFLLPDGIFSSADRLQHADKLSELKEHLLHLEVQQFVFDLKDFLLAHRDLDGFSLMARERSTSSEDDYVQLHHVYAKNLLDAQEDPIYICENPLYCKIDDFIAELNHSASLVSYFIEHHQHLTFEKLSQANEEQLLPIVMSQILGPERFSMWEAHYLKSQATLTPSTTESPTKKSRPSL